MHLLWVAGWIWVQVQNPIAGRVVDGRTREPVAHARVVLGETQTVVTGDNGVFEFREMTTETATIYVNAVGYAMARKTVNAAMAVEALEIILVPEGAALRESITVTTAPFEGIEPAAASQQTLSKSELQSAAMVLVGDPLRSAQALPGVVANNDLRTDFAVRGASFDRVGVYVDGVLTDNFVHSFVGADSNDRVSLSLINQDTVGGFTLLPGAFPSNYGDSTAAIAALDTREGNRVRPTGRFGTGLLATSAVVDGPFAHNRGAWLLSARTSYIDYLERLIQRVTGTGDSAGGDSLTFSDVSSNVNLDISPASHVGLTSVFGLFNGNQGAKNREQNKDDPDSVDTFDSRNLLLNAHWRYSPNRALVSTTRGFLTRSRYGIEDVFKRTLDSKDRTQFGLRSDAGVQLGRSHHIDTGFYGRVMQAKKASWSYRAVPPFAFERFDRSAFEDSYYLQDTWSVESLKLSLTGGGRLEHNNLTRQTVISPRMAMTMGVPGHLVIRAGFGAYRQMPDFDAVFGFFGNPGLQSEKAAHYNVSVERLLDSRTRVVVEAYDREERGLIFSLAEPRLNSTGQGIATADPYHNSLNGYARGAEVTIQRRSANGLSGWASYAYSRTWLRDGASGLAFVSDVDQRHTVNMFGSYRLTQTFGVSSQIRYGSGQPIPGFIRRDGKNIELTTQRNTAQLTDYSRVDVRATKSFPHPGWKWTLSGEILNVLGHSNQYIINSNIIRFRSTGQYSAGFGQSFGILPSAGVYFEF